jgi:hypothetical protein
LPADARDRNNGEWPEGLDLGTDLITVVPPTDPRVRSIREEQSVVSQILDSFRSTDTGKPYEPAVLLIRRSAPDSVRRSEEAIVAFRNAVTISVVLRGRAADARGYGAMSTTWPDTFDFHPAQVSAGGRFVILSPALSSLVAKEDPLCFTESPYLPRQGRRIWPDAYLYRTLGVEWKRRYAGNGRSGQFGQALFRSLEVAYSACAIGAKNQGSIHDYGLQVALWVSAIEILAWPDQRHADFDRVLDLFAKAPLHRQLRVRRYSAKRRGKVRKVNALERAYSYLYNARNSFLHGNPVTSSTLFTRSRKAGTPIPRLATTVYRAALTAYLSKRHDPEIRSMEDLKARPGELGLRMTYDQALAEHFGIDLRAE